MDVKQRFFFERCPQGATDGQDAFEVLLEKRSFVNNQAPIKDLFSAAVHPQEANQNGTEDDSHRNCSLVESLGVDSASDPV